MNYYGIERSEEYLAHFGTKRHSGRYPWGTGDRPYQDDPENLSKNEVKRLVKEYNETHGTKIKVKNAIIKMNVKPSFFPTGVIENKLKNNKVYSIFYKKS